ncbi:hypothetical protein ScPMuIL_009067 [Solemya velum]
MDPLIAIALFIGMTTGTSTETQGVRKNQLYQITKIAVDILEGQMTLWATIERSTTSCCAKCLLQEECFLSVYFPNRTCIGYGRLWVMLTKTHVDESRTNAYAMIRTVESVQCPADSIHVETAGNWLKFSTYRETWNDALEECQAMGGTLVEIESEEKEKFIAKFASVTYEVQCPADSIHVENAGNWLKFSTYGETWNDALEECQAMGGTLVEIESEEKEKFIAKFASVTYEEINSMVWLGATSDRDEWTWAGSGSRVEYTHWYGYPEGGCAALITIGPVRGWKSYMCNMLYKYVCEKQTVD